MLWKYAVFFFSYSSPSITFGVMPGWKPWCWAKRSQLLHRNKQSNTKVRNTYFTKPGQHAWGQQSAQNTFSWNLSKSGQTRIHMFQKVSSLTSLLNTGHPIICNHIPSVLLHALWAHQHILFEKKWAVLDVWLSHHSYLLCWIEDQSSLYSTRWCKPLQITSLRWILKPADVIGRHVTFCDSKSLFFFKLAWKPGCSCS